MEPDTQGNRVFVLGAGFSKASGMPDAKDLTRLILDAGFLLDNEDFRAWINDIKTRIAHLEGFHGINIEQLFDFAHFDRELWLMKQQECPVDRSAGDTPYSKAEEIGAWLEYMEMGLVEVLLDEQDKANKEVFDLFVQELRRHDTVVTFNYDTLLEDRLATAGKTWTHGFDNEPPAEVQVLKLHGSLDWWLSHRDRPIDGAPVLFSKEDSNFDWKNASVAMKDASEWEYKYRLQRVNTLQESRVLNSAHTGVDKGERRYPGLGGLGAHKPLHRLVGSGVVWRKAFDALKQADEVIVVGWSCSPYDVMARFHFSGVMRIRKQPPSRTILVDPYADRICKNLAPVFGDLVLFNKEWQEANLGKILG